MLASEIGRALNGRKVGGSWMARCPAHKDRKPSLSISASNDGKVLVHCHAGCDQRDVIAALRELGLWETTGTSEGRSAATHHRRVSDEATPRLRSAPRRPLRSGRHPNRRTARRSKLICVGVDCVFPRRLPCASIAGLRHPSGARWPAMVALVTHGDTGLPLAIHRTFLARDGFGKAPVDPQKMMLGPCRGGAVRLGEPGRRSDGRRRDRDLPCGHAGDRTRRPGQRFQPRACGRSICRATFAT